MASARACLEHLTRALAQLGVTTQSTAPPIPLHVGDDSSKDPPFLTAETLRRAKFNHPAACAPLWRALHDLSLVGCAGFPDPDIARRALASAREASARSAMQYAEAQLASGDGAMNAGDARSRRAVAAELARTAEDETCARVARRHLRRHGYPHVDELETCDARGGDSRPLLLASRGWYAPSPTKSSPQPPRPAPPPDLPIPPHTQPPPRHRSSQVQRDDVFARAHADAHAPSFIDASPGGDSSDLDASLPPFPADSACGVAASTVDAADIAQLVAGGRNASLASAAAEAAATEEGAYVDACAAALNAVGARRRLRPPRAAVGGRRRRRAKTTTSPSGSKRRRSPRGSSRCSRTSASWSARGRSGGTTFTPRRRAARDDAGAGGGGRGRNYPELSTRRLRDRTRCDWSATTTRGARICGRCDGRSRRTSRRTMRSGCRPRSGRGWSRCWRSRSERSSREEETRAAGAGTPLASGDPGEDPAPVPGRRRWRARSGTSRRTSRRSPMPCASAGGTSSARRRLGTPRRRASPRERERRRGWPPRSAGDRVPPTATPGDRARTPSSAHLPGRARVATRARRRRRPGPRLGADQRRRRRGGAERADTAAAADGSDECGVWAGGHARRERGVPAGGGGEARGARRVLRRRVLRRSVAVVVAEEAGATVANRGFGGRDGCARAPFTGARGLGTSARRRSEPLARDFERRGGPSVRPGPPGVDARLGVRALLVPDLSE